MKVTAENELIEQTAAPAVTVLMPVYNAERHLREAVSSILAQTFCDFEFLIVDDGSNDGTREILGSFTDARIIVLHLPENRGVVGALNAGLDIARGRYIARMDADDVALPHRLARQVEFMEAHPDIGVCGTWFTMQGDMRNTVVRHPTTHQAIMEQLLHVGCVLGHPTVMIRTQALGSRRYRSIYRHAEDYGLWAEMAGSARFANLPEVCLQYRSHGAQISVRHARSQGEVTQRIRAQLICSVDDRCTAEQRAAIESLAVGIQPLHADAVSSTGRALKRLLQANRACARFKARPYERLLATLWYRACFRSPDRGLRVLKRMLLATPAPLLVPDIALLVKAARYAVQRLSLRLRAVVSAVWLRPGVVVRVSGDLPSQMFQYAAARALAGTYRVPVRLDLSDYAFFKMHSYHLSEFAISARPASHGETMRLRRRGSTFIELLDRIIPSQRRVVEPAWTENTPGDWPRGNLRRSVLVGHWQDPRYFEAWQEVLRGEFRPHRAMLQPQAELAARLAATESVAVFASPAPYATARDGVTHRWPMSAPASFYEQAIARVRHKYPQAELFLFSSLTGGEKAEWPHLAQHTTVPVHEDRPSDLYLMSHARHFIIPASLFAWWAAWLGRHPSKEVIAPAAWWRVNRLMPSPLALAQWTLLASEP